MFPFGYSPYLSMYEQQEEERRRREQQSRRGGFLLPRTYGGEAVPEDAARRARAQGFVALGLPLLQAASTGDYGGALAQGLGGMNAAMQGVLEEERQIGRQRESDRLQREAEERRQQHETDYFENLRRDDERKAAEDERKRAEARAEVEREEAERKAEVARRRELIEKVRGRDPNLADQLDALAESDKFPYGEAVAATRAENPFAAAREERAAAAAERSARTEERTLESIQRQGAQREQGRIDDKADEIFNDWLYGDRMGIATAAERAAQRLEATRRATQEVRGGSAQPSPRVQDEEPPPPARRNSIGGATPDEVELQLGRKLDVDELRDVTSILARGGTIAEILRLLSGNG